MKKITFILFTFLFIYLASCKDNSTPVNNINNPPSPDTGWVLSYHDYNIGTFFCTWPQGCFEDAVTDTIDMTNYDSMRVYMSYHSIRNNSLEIYKIPYPVVLYSCVFTDSSYGKLDKTFGSYKTKYFLDFMFDVGTRISIDTLQVYKKLH